MIPMKNRSIGIVCVAACSLVLGVAGCAGHTHRDGEPAASAVVTLDLQGADVSRVFDAARESLMEYRFSLDRVDARRGVITTHPKRTAGLATPWDQEQSGLDQEWEDLLNEQRRIVRIDFDQDGDRYSALQIQVEVVRTHRPGWRIETESVRLSEHARIRDRDGELMPMSFGEVIGLDTRFAQRLAESISARLSSATDEQ